MNQLLAIMLSFMKIGLLAFGGGYASVPLVEREVVEIQHWMSYAEFANLMALDEVTPGPIIINSATFVGMRVAGVAGAIAATVACVIPPCLISLCLVLAYRKLRSMNAMKEVIAALKCMAIGLIAATLVRLFSSLVFGGGAGNGIPIDACALAMIAASFFVMRKTEVSPVIVLLGCGAVYLAFHTLVGI